MEIGWAKTRFVPSDYPRRTYCVFYQMSSGAVFIRKDVVCGRVVGGKGHRARDRGELQPSQ